MPFTSTTEWIGWLLAITLSALGLAPAAQAAPAEPAVTAAGDAADPLIVAHRGASGHAPENTLAAADAAADLHTRWVETDVQRTADGELVLIHDTTLSRTTNVEQLFPDRAPWNVADFTAEEIATLDAGSWYGPEFAGEAVPTLADFLDRLADNRQRLLLELKAPERYPGIEADILEVLGEEGWLNERHPGQRLVLQSFNVDSVREVHRLAPELETGLLGTVAVADIPRYAEFADQINTRHRDLTAEYVAAVQAAEGPHGDRVELHTWTVNDAATAVRVAELGVDGIITDVPDVVRQALSE